MTYNAKSSVTLPADEVALIYELRSSLGIKSKVEVVRRGLRLLKERSDRSQLKDAYRDASRRVQAAIKEELCELDHLAGEGLEEA